MRRLFLCFGLLLAVVLRAEEPGPDEPAAPPAAPRVAQPARLMAVTIDDLPVGPPRAHSIDEQRRITESLIAVLEKHAVPAIGFVNEDKLEVDGAVDPARVALLERWLDAGFELGNHGYSHLDLHRVDRERWQRDVLRGERVLRPLLAKRDRAPRYFRHPFLHTGRSLEIKAGTERFLADHGYRVAPVTIDNQEWIFGGAYAESADDPDRRERLGEAYVDYMLAMVAYYEQQAEAIVGEAIPQVLLIHAYALNADWLDPLLTGIAARGYRFISLDDALEHPAYGSEDTYVGPGGITWLHRWAITRGLPPSIFATEPSIPSWLRP